MARRYYSSTARRTTLAADINSSVTSLTVAAVSGWPSSFPYTLVLDEGTLSEELVEVSARSGTTVTVTRGVDGTSAVAHTAGATVNHGVSARDFNEPNQFLNEGGTVAGATVVEANSSSAALRITQTGAGNALLVEDSTNPDATPFVVDASGFVVHNHTSSISVAGVNPRIQSHSLTTNPVANIAAYNWTNGTQPAGLTFVKSRSTTPGSFSAVQSGDQAGSITFFGDDGAQFVPAALIQGVIDGTPGTNDMPGRLVFSTTADGASSPTERMRITSAGNVGIGTSSPGYPLHVVGNATITGDVGIGVNPSAGLLYVFGKTPYFRTDNGEGVVTINVRSATAAHAAVLNLEHNGSTSGASPDNATLGQVRWVGRDSAGTYMQPAAIEVVIGTNASGGAPASMRFYTSPTGAGPAERMRIDNAGLITGTGTSLGAWTAYTPTLGNWTDGTGTASGAYCQIGKVVIFRAKFTFGGAPTVSSFPTLTLPVTAKTARAGTLTALLLDNGGSEYLAVPVPQSTTAVGIFYLGTNGVRSTPNATTPFTIGANDSYEIYGTYEAA